MTNLLEGAYDLHVHTAPDVVSRKLDDRELARSYVAAGIKGAAIKAHYFNTEGRAYHLRQEFPDFHAIGCVVLNNSMGGLNPYAARQAGMLGTKLVFMPTMDAQNMWDYLDKSKDKIPFGASSKSAGEVKAICVYDNGKLAEPIEEIIDIIIQYDMVLCTGHISPVESLALLARAQEKGLKKLIATHVEWPATCATLEQQKKYVACGAYLEHNIANIMSGDLPIEDLVAQVKEIGAEHMILSTDLGQAINPEPVKAFEEYVQKLLDADITQEEIRLMIAENPAKLVE